MRRSNDRSQETHCAAARPRRGSGAAPAAGRGPADSGNRVVLDEPALRRAFGGRAVMAAQLCRLHDAASDDRVTLQILPFSAGAHMTAHGSFRLFDPETLPFP
jgi:hypothetical protein